MSLLSALPPAFTRDDTPALRSLVEQDLASLVHGLRALVPDASLHLGGSFAQGEAVAWERRGRLVAFSDYDLFLGLPGWRWLSPRRLAWLRREAGTLARTLGNSAVDLNILLPAGRSRAWQPSGALVDLVGGGVVAPSAPTEARWSFVLHTLHGVQEELLGLAPASAKVGLRQWHGVNRCALRVLRAAWNLECGERPVYALSDCAAPLEGAWGATFEPELRILFSSALGENPGLGLRALSRDPSRDRDPANLGARWLTTRRAAVVLHERWSWWRAGAGAAARALLGREDIKTWLRLAAVQILGGRAPRLTAHPHDALLRARRELLAAVVRPGVVAPHQLRTAWRALRALGLVRRTFPADPREAWSAATRAARVGNPLRVAF